MTAQSTDLPGTGVGATRALAEFVESLDYADLPREVVSESKRLLLDVVGNIIGGGQIPLGESAVRYSQAAGGRGETSVIGQAITLPAPMAAYANARLGDVLDASDTFMGVCHLGNPIVSAALAIGEERSLSGKQLITAVAVGMEVGARIAASAGPPRPRLQAADGEPQNFGAGRMPAPDMGTVAACASLLRFDTAQTSASFGIAGANAAIHATRWGSHRPLPEQKYADYGLFAHNGVTSALMVESGLTSHPDVLDGPWGLWRLRGVAHCDFDVMLADLGTRWYSLDNTYKAWPSCRWTHHTLTLFERMMRIHSIDPSHIERIDVKSHLYGVAPYFCDQFPRTVVDCEFNHAHGIAMLARGIPPGPWWYENAAIGGEQVSELRQRVFVSLDERSLDAEQWFVDGQIRKLPSRVSVHVRGQVFEDATDYAVGDPWDPETRMSDAQLKEKFLFMGSRKGPSDRRWGAHAEAIFEMLGRLEAVPDVGTWVQLLSAPGLPIRRQAA